MNIAWARQILSTYTLPMSAEQLRQYKLALVIVSGSWGRAPGGPF